MQKPLLSVGTMCLSLLTREALAARDVGGGREGGHDEVMKEWCRTSQYCLCHCFVVVNPWVRVPPAFRGKLFLSVIPPPVVFKIRPGVDLTTELDKTANHPEGRAVEPNNARVASEGKS